MESRIVITAVPPYSGEYSFDLGVALSAREWRWIKEISEYLPLTLDKGLAGGDPSVICALAVVALVRNGKIDRDEALAAADALLDAPFDESRIQFIPGTDQEEEDALPPASVSEPDESSSPSSLTNGTPETSSINSSGKSSRISSARSEEIPSPTGATK